MFAALLAAGSLALASGPSTSADGIKFHAWAEGGWSAFQTHGDSWHNMPYLSMARLSSKYQHTISRYQSEERFGNFVQIEAKNGTVELLDARVDFDLAPWVGFKAGRFKTSVSNEFLVPAPKLLYRLRPALVDLTPKRKLGAELDFRPHMGEAQIDLQTGVFAAEDPWVVPDEEDLLFIGRARYLGPQHLIVHAAGMRRTASDPHDAGTITHEADAALGFERDEAQVIAEGLVAWREDAEVPDVGTTINAARRFGDLDDGIAFEPAVEFDVNVQGGEITYCESAALNIFWDGWNVVQMINVDFHQGPDGNRTAVFVQLRGGR